MLRTIAIVVITAACSSPREDAPASSASKASAKTTASLGSGAAPEPAGPAKAVRGAWDSNFAFRLDTGSYPRPSISVVPAAESADLLIGARDLPAGTQVILDGAPWAWDAPNAPDHTLPISDERIADLRMDQVIAKRPPMTEPIEVGVKLEVRLPGYEPAMTEIPPQRVIAARRLQQIDKRPLPGADPKAKAAVYLFGTTVHLVGTATTMRDVAWVGVTDSRPNGKVSKCSYDQGTLDNLHHDFTLTVYDRATGNVVTSHTVSSLGRCPSSTLVSPGQRQIEDTSVNLTALGAWLKARLAERSA